MTDDNVSFIEVIQKILATNMFKNKKKKEEEQPNCCDAFSI
jgi:hypothetical protein